MFLNTTVETIPVTYAEVRNVTRKDPVQSKVTRYVEPEWPITNDDPKLSSLFHRKQELSLHHQILMWKTRVIIPTKLRH